MTWFCPACFIIVDERAIECASCGADLVALDRDEWDEKLRRALRHHLPDRRVLAARALGLRRTESAVDDLVAIAESDLDPYVAAAAVAALASIGGGRAMDVVARIAATGPAVPRAAARAALG